MNYNFSSEYWRLPKNYPELIAAVNWAAGDRLTLSVHAPLSVAVELAEQSHSGDWILHMVNFDFTRPVADIAVKLRLPGGRELKEAIVETPDSSEVKVLKTTIAGDVTSFRVPRLEIYNLVRLTFAKPRS